MEKEQISMFGDEPEYPAAVEDIERLYNDFLFEGENDPDVFTWNEIKNGRSYFFYGKKAFEFAMQKSGSWRLRLSGSCFPASEAKEDGKFYTLDPKKMAAPMSSFLDKLREQKRKAFDELEVDSFGCCNDFTKCSDVRMCIHAGDRFYNRCMYRKNLEAGRIFYGKNRNV